MYQWNDHDEAGKRTSARASLLILGFGLAVLAFLVAIDRPSWFRIRPVSGTATAMSYASTTPLKSTPAQPVQH